MAKYTETLGEYLESGHTLPAIFDDITDFDKHFLARYIDREIGFETEALFEIKLEGKANIIIPLYKDRIQQLNDAITALSTPSYKVTKDNTGYYTHDADIQDSGTEKHERDLQDSGSDGHSLSENTVHGAQSGTRTQLPFNSSTSQPNEKTETAQYTDNHNITQDQTTFGKKTDDDTTITFGKKVDNDLRHEDHLKEEVTHTGFTTAENLARINLLQGELFDMIDRCLKEFSHLFMQIYT